MRSAVLCLLLALAAGHPASADQLLIEKINLDAATPRPDRGVTMNSVRSRFGDPAEVRGPVGDPPITRWVYSDFTVFFEHNRVIHAVARR